MKKEKEECHPDAKRFASSEDIDKHIEKEKIVQPNIDHGCLKGQVWSVSLGKCVDDFG